MSQQPYQPTQQTGQPSGYPQSGQPQGYPQGYQQAGSPGYGGYQQQRRGGMDLNSAAGLAPIIQILGYVVAALGLLAGILSFTIDGFSGSYKFQQFVTSLVLGFGLGGLLLGLSGVLRNRSS